MLLTEETIRAGLKTSVVGSTIHCREIVDSTNEEGWREGVRGASDGTVIFAEEQRAGRGRMGRRWTAPRGKGLLFSVILRPRLAASRVGLVTAIGALTVVDALHEACGLRPEIRFPNDVLIGGRKIAGILVESRFISNIADIFVVGIGLNVNMDRADFPPDIQTPATSVFLESGREAGRALLARRMLEALDRWYEVLLHGSPAAITARWREVSMVIGKRVAVREGDRVTEGVVDDVDPVEGVILRTANGTVAHIRGEFIEHLRIIG